MHSLTDPEMIQAILCGERLAGEELVDRYSGLVWSAILKFGLPPDQADDLFQRVFEKLWDRDCRCLRDWKREGSLAGYLYRIARNLCLDTVRAQKGPGSVSLGAANSEGDWVEIRLEDPGPGPEELAELNALREAISEVLDALPELDRKVLRLHYLEGLKQREVGVIIGRDVKQIGSLITRALEKARKRLEQDYPGMF